MGSLHVVQTELDYWLDLGGSAWVLSRLIQERIDEELEEWVNDSEDTDRAMGHFLPTLAVYYTALRELEELGLEDEEAGG